MGILQRLLGFVSGPAAGPSQSASTDIQKAATGWGVAGSGDGDGFSAPPKSAYQVYRSIIGHPTVALARAAVHFPILAGAWTVAEDSDAPAGAADFVRRRFLPQRSILLAEAMRAVDYGWQPFEIVWEMTEAEWFPKKFKPLLPELTSCMVEESGAFGGLKNRDVEIGAMNSLVITYDGEGGNFYGRSRCENIRKLWANGVEVNERSAGLISKVAGILPVIHYPPGKEKDQHGRDVSSFEAAQAILDSLRRGKGVAIPNLFASSNDPETQAQLAGKAKWVISFLESASASSALAAITGRMEYDDKLLCRGWLVPERSVIEATTAGARADSLTAASLSLLGSMLLDRDICRQISWYVLDDALELNFGPAARGKVRLESAPLTDEVRVISAKLLDAVIANPGTFEELVDSVDWAAIADALNIPTTQDLRIAGAAGGSVPDAASKALASYTAGAITREAAIAAIVAVGYPVADATAAVDAAQPTQSATA